MKALHLFHYKVNFNFKKLMLFFHKYVLFQKQIKMNQFIDCKHLIYLK